MRVVIAEDSVLLREGLTRLLTEAGHEVAAAEGDAEKFLRAVDAHRPDAVVVDVRMPPTFTDEGLRAALVVRDRWPDTGVLVLSQWVEEQLERAVGMRAVHHALVARDAGRPAPPAPAG